MSHPDDFFICAIDKNESICYPTILYFGDTVRIESVIDDYDPETGASVTPAASLDEADMFSLFIRAPDGTMQVFADYPTMREALLNAARALSGLTLDRPEVAA
jgi:hypothetical protein